MFRENQQHLQQPLFSTISSLPKKLQKRLKVSWADTFYKDIFARIEERDFEILYSDQPSRPNIPVNVLVGLEILKAGFGWTDEETHEGFSYNIQVRYALGYANVEEGHFELRTLYNFRKRLTKHMQETGENLFERCFVQITDEQMAAYAIKSGTQRTDSKQIASNIRRTTRLQLLIEVLQRTYRMLQAADKLAYHALFAPYIKEKSGRYLYRLKGEKHQSHIEQVGVVMAQLVAELTDKYAEVAAFAVLQRVFTEHFIVEAVGLRPKKGGELTADSLQSPDDLEATFRKKRGESFVGYVTNVTETADPDNPFQLITKVQTESNTTDDAKMLAEAIPELTARTELERMHSDGSYNSAQVDKICHAEGVVLVQTAIRGGNPSSKRINLADFTIVLDEQGNPIELLCPNEKTGVVTAGRKAERLVATFDHSDCLDCPLLARCQMRVLKKEAGRRLYFSVADVQLAQRRQRMRAERNSGRNLRSAVEATMHEISCRLEHGHLRVRGKFRVGMTMLASAAMANARRIWRYKVAEKIAVSRRLETQNGQIIGVVGNTAAYFRLRGRIMGRTSRFTALATILAHSHNLQVVFKKHPFFHRSHNQYRYPLVNTPYIFHNSSSQI